MKSGALKQNIKQLILYYQQYQYNLKNVDIMYTFLEKNNIKLDTEEIEILVI